MFLRIVNYMKAEFIFIFKHPATKWSMILALVIYSYIIKTSSKMISKVNGFFTSQVSLTTIIILSFLTIVIGALMSCKEYDYNTYAIKLIYASRNHLILYKLLTLFVISIIYSTFGLILGMALDLLSGGLPDGFTINMFYQLLACIMALFFWGILSFLIALITKSFTFSITVCIAYTFLEAYFNNFITSGVNNLLPLWNIKNLIYKLYPTDGGIVILLNEYKPMLNSFIIMIAYSTVILIAIIVTYKRRNFE